MQCHPLPIWRSTWHTVLGLLGAGMRHAGCGMRHGACCLCTGVTPSWESALAAVFVRTMLFLFLLTACCMRHVAVASIRSRRCATNKLRMRSHHMEVGQVPHRPDQHTHTHHKLTQWCSRRGNAAMSKASLRVASRGMQIRECLWVNIFGCARAAVLTPFGGFGLGRQIKPVSNALSLSSLPATCSIAAILHFLHSQSANEFLRSASNDQLQLAMCDIPIDTSAYLAIVELVEYSILEFYTQLQFEFNYRYIC